MWICIFMKTTTTVECWLSLNYGVKGSVIQTLAETLELIPDVAKKNGQKLSFSLRTFVFSLYRLAVIEECYPCTEARLRYSRRDDFYTRNRKSYKDLSMTSLLEVIDLATYNGLISGAMGFFDFKTGRRKCSYFCLTEKSRQLVHRLSTFGILSRWTSWRSTPMPAAPRPRERPAIS